MLLVFMLSPVALVSGQSRSDRSRDSLFGPVQTVVETYSQSECGPGRYGGSVAITSYDREGHMTTEAYDPSFCYSPVIHYRHDPDGSVHSYQDGNRCGDMPVQIPLYKIWSRGSYMFMTERAAPLRRGHSRQPSPLLVRAASRAQRRISLSPSRWRRFTSTGRGHFLIGSRS